MLEIRLVGAIEARSDGRVLRLPTGRPLELFAWLACHPGCHPRSRLAPLFWGDVSDAASRASLRTALWMLRRSLGDAAGVLRVDRDEIGLDDAAVRVDLREFASLADAGQVEGALELATGEILPGVVAEWADEIREQHRRRLAGLLKALADQAETGGDLQGALERSRQQARLDPFDEEPHRDVLRLLVATGQAALGAREHAAFRRRLWQELRVLPSPQTTRLANELGACADSGRVADRLPARLQEAESQPFVGRLDILDQLRTIWRDGRDRRCRQVIVVTGEPGMGKTRLAGRFGAIVGDLGGRVLYGAADEDGLVPGGPFVEALDLSAGDPPEQLLWAASARLAAISEALPVLLVLDDLHWADTLTLALLRRSARGSYPGAVTVMITCRHTDDPGAKVTGLVADLERGCEVVRLALTGLSRAESAQLLDLLAHPTEAASRLHAHTGGNPFLMKEMARFLAEGDRGATGPEAEIPVSIRDLVTARLRRLSRGAAEFLAVAAVIGNQSTLAMIRDVLGTADAGVDALDELLASGWLVEREAGSVAFTHALIREAVYAGLSKARRAEFHRRIAGAYGAMAGEGDGPHLCDAALHSCAAVPVVPVEAALRDAQRAADWAISHQAYGQAVIVLTRALEIAPPAERADLTVRRAVAYTRLTHAVIDPAPTG